MVSCPLPTGLSNTKKEATAGLSRRLLIPFVHRTANWQIFLPYSAYLAEFEVVWQSFFSFGRFFKLGGIWSRLADFSNLAEFWRNFVYLGEFHKNDSGQRHSDVGSRKLILPKSKNRRYLELLPLSRALLLLCYTTDKQVFQHRPCPVHT